MYDIKEGWKEGRRIEGGGTKWGGGEEGENWKVNENCEQERSDIRPSAPKNIHYM